MSTRRTTAPRRTPSLAPTNPGQDEVEIALARRAVADGKPVLGICRGIQLLNVALGGTLYQDIPCRDRRRADHQANRSSSAT